MKNLLFILCFLPSLLIGQILHRDAIGGSFTYTVDSFTSSGTWTKPSGVDFVYVYVIGGGSGGRSGRRGAAASNRGGGGAGSPIPIISRFQASDLNSTEAVVVGAGGGGGAAITADNTNGTSGTSGGSSYIRSSGFLASGGAVGAYGGSTSVFTSASATGSVTSSVAWSIIIAPMGISCLGSTAASSVSRGFDPGNYYYWRNATSGGGSISNTNVQNNSGTLSGFYDNATFTLTGEESGVGEGVNGGFPATGYTIGEYFNHYFPWFNAADITSELPRGGIGGGPGNTAGTIAGGNGGPGRGRGGSGGGGGASTNGANSGAGGAGNNGIVIFVNVFL